MFFFNHTPTPRLIAPSLDTYILVFNFFVSLLNSNLCCPYIIECVTFFWRMVTWPGTILLKETAPASLKSSVGNGIWSELSLPRFCHSVPTAVNFHVHVSLLCTTDTISCIHVLHLRLYSLSTPFYTMTSWVLAGDSMT